MIKVMEIIFGERTRNMKLKYLYFFIFSFFAVLISSCVQEDNRSDAEKYPNVNALFFEFFDATIFQDKNNKVAQLPEISEKKSGEYFYSFYVKLDGTFAPELKGYLKSGERIASFVFLTSIKTTFVNDNSSDILYFGFNNPTLDGIQKAYSTYTNFMEGDVEISSEEFAKTDFTKTCFVQRKKVSGRIKTFAAILYDENVDTPYSYKERVASCYFGSLFVQLGVWPFSPGKMKTLVTPIYSFQSKILSGVPSVKEPVVKDALIPLDEKKPVLLTKAFSLQWPFMNEDIYEGMGRSEFYRMVDNFYLKVKNENLD